MRRAPRPGASVGRRRREPVYAATVLGGRVLLRALDLRVRAQGAEHVPATGPVVLVANHVSFPDFVFVGRALPPGRRVRFMCRHDIWGNPLLARAMDAMDHIPVDRATPASAYLKARRLLDDGQAVCVFPEGGISTALTVRALMPGAVALARETGAPLVPVTLWGGQRLWPQRQALGDPLPRPVLSRGRLVDVHVGVPWAVPPDADVVGTTHRLGHHLHRHLERLQQLPEHRPQPGRHAPWYPAHLGGHAMPREQSFVLDQMPTVAVGPTWGPGLTDADSSVADVQG